MTATLIEVRGLSRRFSGVLAVNRLDLDIYEGEVLAVIGPNGSGKTTLFNMLSGFLAPTEGTIRLKGERLDRKRPEEVVRRGVARTFQQTMTFPALTVRENISIALLARRHSGPSRTREDVLALCGLSEVAGRISASLPYGLQKKLGVALALATRPEVLLLDEPAAGLGGSELEGLAELILNVQKQGITVAVIDHDMPFVLPISERVVVLDAGQKLFEGTASEARADQQVIKAYLGEDV